MIGAAVVAVALINVAVSGWALMVAIGILYHGGVVAAPLGYHACVVVATLVRLALTPTLTIGTGKRQRNA